MDRKCERREEQWNNERVTKDGTREREGGTKSELIQGQINKEEKSRAAFIMISNLN